MYKLLIVFGFSERWC